MIDLHCHILPGVDDGAPDLDVSCDMAAMALETGTDVIVATPHCNSPRGGDNFRSAALDGVFASLQERLDHFGLRLRVLPGSEVQLHGDTSPILRRDLLYTLNNSRYLLVEFPFDASPAEMERQLADVHRAGFVPVVAHPERYDAVQDDLALPRAWVRKGAVLQVNKGSLAGELGRACFRTADALLRQGLAAAVGSDAHNARRRTPVLRPLRYGMREQFSEDYLELLFEVNPRRIIEDREILLP